MKLNTNRNAEKGRGWNIRFNTNQFPTVLSGWLLSLFFLALTPCKGCAEGPPGGGAEGVEIGRVLDATGGAVVSVEPLASEVGAGVLAAGGTAVDAAIATAFALAVTWPEAGNLGGGGFMLIRQADGEEAFIDYREMAPQAASEDLFLTPEGEVDRVRVRLGYLPVGVPGTVAGMYLAYKDFGTISWANLVAPAANLAERGFPVSEALARSLAAHSRELFQCEEARKIFFSGEGETLAAGDWLRQPDLARTLRLIEKQGPDAFYRGAISELIVADSESRDGILTRADFSSYKAVRREPIRGEYGGHEILAGPPPTSGGIVIVQSLNQLKKFDLARFKPGSPGEIHLLGEVQRRSFLDRALHLADPEYIQNPVKQLLDEGYGLSLAEGIDPNRATPSDHIAGDMHGTLPPQSGNTTHFSVVDRFGNAVANTYTLEESWGAKIVARGTGIVLNNEMHDFNVDPGKSSRKGRIGTAPNRIEPGKRMLSSMCPVIVTHEGKVTLVAGSPGGRTIPSTVLRVITGMIDHGLTPQQAIQLDRVHHGLYPDVLVVEETFPQETRDALTSMGHVLKPRRSQGDCHVIAWNNILSRLDAVADHRIAGAAAAVSSR